MKRSPIKRTAFKRGQPGRSGRSMARFHAPLAERDGEICQGWAAGVRHIRCAGSPQAHHLWRQGQGGPDELWNLKLVCAAHHQWIHGNVGDAKLVDLIRVPGDTDGSLTRARSGMV